MVWVVAIFDKDLEKNAIGSYRRKIIIQSRNLVPKEKITNILAKYSTEFYLFSTSLNKKEKTSTMTYVLEGPKEKIESLLKSFYNQSWCLSVKFE